MFQTVLLPLQVFVKAAQASIEFSYWDFFLALSEALHARVSQYRSNRNFLSIHSAQNQCHTRMTSAVSMKLRNMKYQTTQFDRAFYIESAHSQLAHHLRPIFGLVSSGVCYFSKSWFWPGNHTILGGNKQMCEFVGTFWIRIGFTAQRVPNSAMEGW